MLFGARTTTCGGFGRLWPLCLTSSIFFFGAFRWWVYWSTQARSSSTASSLCASMWLGRSRRGGCKVCLAEPLLLSAAAMGATSSRQRQVLLVGLDAAGKSTMLAKLKGKGEIERSAPTEGFQVETLVLNATKLMKLESFDVGGRAKIRPLLRHFYSKTDAVIFVVDSSDRERLSDARSELQRMLLEEELHGKPLLIYANKRDVASGAVTLLIDELGLHDLRNRHWYLQETVATEGQGLADGLDWLMKAMDRQPRPKAVDDDVSTADTEDLAARKSLD